MSEDEKLNAMKERAEPLQSAAVRVRAMREPLSTDGSRPATHSATHPAAGENVAPRTAPSPARAPDRAPPDREPLDRAPLNAAASPGVQRAAHILRAALPFVRQLLPLLDGNVATTVSNVLASRSRSPATPSSGKLDLAPIEEGLAELRSRQHGLRLQVTEQNTSLKRVEDELEALREAVEQSTLAQLKLREESKALGKRVLIAAAVALVLAATGFSIALALFLQMKKVLP